MQITFLSVVHSTLWGSAFIVMICFVRNIPFIKRRCNASLAIWLYGICMLRCVLPLDFQHSVIIPARQFYPQIYEWFAADQFGAGKGSFSAISAMLLVWFAGGCVFLARYGICYFRSVRSIRKFAEPADEWVQQILSRMVRPDQRGLRVCVMPNVTTPCGIGFFRKQIVLPHVSYSEQELYYILQHEYIHVLNHDFLLKQISSFFCILFWWNPAAYLLKNDFEQVLEIRCDAAVTRDMSREGRIAYLETLLQVVQSEQISHFPLPTSIGLWKMKRSFYLVERFNEVAVSRSTGPWGVRNGLVLSAFLLSVGFSYATIFQPSTEPPVSDEISAVDFDASNSYIVFTSQEEYWLYVSDLEPIRISEDYAVSYSDYAGIEMIKE